MTDPDSSAAAMDVFMCVHSRDTDNLFDLSLTSLLAHFPARAALHLVSNDAKGLRQAVDRLEVEGATVWADDDWLSVRERALPGWYRQQVIKLRSFEFCATEHYVNLGADTVLLRAVDPADLVSDGEPILTFTRHRPPDQHWLYERIRLANVAKHLGVRPRRARRYVDFINDFFCFARDDVIALDSLLRTRHGQEPYAAIIEPLGSVPSKQRQFGEWTLYATFVLDVLHRRPTMREAGQGFVSQVRNAEELARFRFDTQVAHFVSKDIDAGELRGRLAALGIDPASGPG